VSAPPDAARVGRDTLGVLISEHERFAAFLRRRLRDPEAAEDVLHAAYAKVLSRDSGPRDRSRVVAWFFRVLRRALLDHLRHEAAGRRSLAGRGAAPSLSRREEVALRSDVCECVTALLSALPRDQADLLRRVEIGGDSVREAASSLGITANNAAVRLHRARAALVESLRGVCGTCTTHGCLRCECRRTAKQPL
jgi:RNA polymerase sigma factor (sigma-70 family)